GVSGTVGTSITHDCNGAAVPPSIVQSLVKLFAGEVSFQKLQRGDRFRVLYEVHVDQAGNVVRIGRIRAAEVVTRGKPHVAIYFEGNEDGKSGYYDLSGRLRGQNPVSAGFYPPVRDARLTSVF